MSRRLSLRGWGSSLGLTTGYLARAATQWFLLWFFAATAGPQGAGQFSLAMALSAPVFIFSQLGMRNLYMSMRDRPGLSTFFNLRTILSLAAGGVVLTIVAIRSDIGASIVGPVIAIKFFDSLTDICVGALHANGRTSRVTASMYANAVGTTTGAGAVFYLTGDPISSLWASAVASALVFAYFGIPVLRAYRTPTFGGLRARLTESGVIARSGLPLAVAEAISTLLAYLPVLYLAETATQTEIGLFSTAMYVITFANLFYSSTQQVWLARLAQEHRAGRLRAAAMPPLIAMAALGLLGAGATFALLPPLLPVIYGPEFGLTHSQVAPLAIAVLMLAFSYAANLLLLVLNRYTRQLYVAASALGVSLVTAFILWDHGSIWAAGVLVATAACARAVGAVTALLRAES
ncbi:lipopolysaccharide biosynthesis protein [Georgenia satyanarayanai]|uniref:lipopolysaccharide biosynthesis protein n=1 Tax=Georgenia satyanarayanai TaxID=860221 RepID=UPI001264EB3C|nr:hypothetical protein [Georgenia satyanarayanai]